MKKRFFSAFILILLAALLTFALSPAAAGKKLQKARRKRKDLL